MDILGSNRTFMELKYLSLDLLHHVKHCSNRTFMELKYNSRSKKTLKLMF